MCWWSGNLEKKEKEKEKEKEEKGSCFALFYFGCLKLTVKVGRLIS